MLKSLNLRLVARLLGMLLLIMSASMVVPLIVSVWSGDGAQFGLALSGLLILMVGLFLRNFAGTGAIHQLQPHESLSVTALIWLIVPMACALPYLFTSSVTNFTDAAFESFSGFTTTGSSVLKDLDNTPKGLLVWRSTSQWVGGMGLILFVVALLLQQGESSARLYEAEFSGTLQRRLHPRMKQNVRLMWLVYIGITFVLFLLLLAGGNGFVDSLCIALSTVSTGGFMTHNDGLAGFSTYSMGVVTLFMFLSGVNLAMLFNLFTFKWKALRHDEELHRYTIIFFAAALLCTVAFTATEGWHHWKESLSFSLFHVASTLSTCGFYTSATSVWPRIVSVITFILIFIGASAGSTGGGLKIKRIMIMVRQVRNYFASMIHPHAVFSVKTNGVMVEEKYVYKIFAFIFLYLIFVVIGAFVLTLCGIDIPDAFCTAAANISNLGPSPVINSIGASLDYASLAPAAKWTMMLLMLAGRLEIFAIVSLFSKSVK